MSVISRLLTEVTEASRAFVPRYGPGGSHEHRIHELSGTRLDDEIKKAEAVHSKAVSGMINAGRGNERYNETFDKAKRGGDPLAQHLVDTWGEAKALYNHRDYRQSHGEKWVRAQGKKRYDAMKAGRELY